MWRLEGKDRPPLAWRRCSHGGVRLAAAANDRDQFPVIKTPISIRAPALETTARGGRRSPRRRRRDCGERRRRCGGFWGKREKKKGVVDLVEGTGELFCCCGLKPTKHCMGQVEVTASPDSWEKLGPPGPGPCSKEFE